MTARTSHARSMGSDEPTRGDHVHVAHGLRIASTRPLDALSAAGAGGRPDVTLRWGTARGQPPPARMTTLLDCRTDDGVLYTALAHDDTYRLQFRNLCEFVIDRRTCIAVCVPTPGTSRTLTEVLASGALLAFLLTMRGDCVLHASAVQVDDLAVAIVGGSGFGKSTVAAALCASGCPLVTDDVLAVDVDAHPRPAARPGTREVRLRPGARGLRHQLPDAATRETADGRLVVAPCQVADAELPLGALVVPRLREDLDAVHVQRLSSSVALRGLLAHPRLLGWRDPAVLRRQLDQMAELARRVPTYVVDMPVGSPVAAQTAPMLRNVLAEQLRRSAAP